MNNLFNHDITFCSNKECTRFECRRHNKNIPIGAPVSVFLIENPQEYNTDKCEMYWEWYTNK